MSSAKSYQIFVVSNAGGDTLRFSLSHAVLKALAGLGFILFLLAVCCGIDYAFLRPHRRTFEQEEAANAALKSELATLEMKYATKVQELDRIHNLTAKLKVITQEPAAREIPIVGGMAVSESESGDSTDAAVIETTSDTPIEGAGGPKMPASEPELRAPASVAGTLPASSALPSTLLQGGLTTRLDQAHHIAQLQEQELFSLWESLSTRESQLMSTPTIQPVAGHFSSPFGYRYDPINGRPLLHAGVDIGAPYGSPVRAPADGMISYVGYEGGYGNLVSIDHGYGIITRFAHNSKILVKEGQRVHRGDPISLVGSTGHSTGAHVHYEVRLHGFPVDPMNYILQAN